LQSVGTNLEHHEDRPLMALIAGTEVPLSKVHADMFIEAA
jgi:hypothetical protein